MKFRKIFEGLLIVGALLGPASAEELTVVVRAENGKFLRLDEQGDLRADRDWAGPEGLFFMQSAPQRWVVFQDHTPDGPGRPLLTVARSARLGSPAAAAQRFTPGDQVPPGDALPEPFRLVPRSPGKFAIYTSEEWTWTTGGTKPFVELTRIPEPAAAETFQVLHHAPLQLNETLLAALTGLLEELAAEALAKRPDFKAVEKHTEGLIDYQTEVHVKLDPKSLQLEVSPQLDFFDQDDAVLGRHPLLGLQARFQAGIDFHGTFRGRVPPLVRVSSDFDGRVELTKVEVVFLGQMDGLQVHVEDLKIVTLEGHLAGLHFSRNILNLFRNKIEQILNRKLTQRQPDLEIRANAAIARSLQRRSEYGVPNLLQSLSRLVH